MKKIKVVAILLCMALVLGLLAACGQSPSSQAPSRRRANSQAAGGGTQAEPAPADSGVRVSSDPHDMEIAIDGVLYTLPAQVSQFTGNGWQLQGGDQLVSYTSFGTGTYETTMTKDGQRLEVQVANFHTMDDAPARDCQVTGVTYSGTGMPVVVAGGITIGSSYDAVWNGYERSIAYSNIVAWSCSELLDYYFEIDETTNTVVSIQIQGGSIDAAAGTYEGSPSAGSGDYIAPTSLGTDWQEGIIRIEGDLYQLPAPVSAFLNNGWELVETEYTDYGDGMIPATGSFDPGGLVLGKDGKQISAAIWNVDSVAQPIANCLLFYMILDDSSISFELPGGLTWDSSIDTVRSLYGAFTDEDDYDDYYYYQDEEAWGMAVHSLGVKYKNGAGALLEVSLLRVTGIDW